MSMPSSLSRALAGLPPRPVGGSGLRLSPLSFGAAPIGNLYQQTSAAEADSALETAWQAGIRYFDTAPHYGLGLSERRVGRALRGRPREEFVLSTKVGRLLVDDPGGAGRRDDEGFDVPATLRRERDYSRDGVLRSIEESLQRLGLDRVDIVYVHDPEDFWQQAVCEAVPALVDLREQGVIGAVGVGMNQAAMLGDFIAQSDIDLVMLGGRYTLLEQGALDTMLPLALRRGVSVVNVGVFNSGLLARETPPAQAMYNYEPAPSALIERARALAAVCGEHGVSLPAAAAQFSLLHPAVVSVAIGCRSGEQVQRNVALFSTPVPTELYEDLVARGLLRADAPIRPAGDHSQASMRGLRA
jgi:D-threo-aldose 1-dehydrogenase